MALHRRDFLKLTSAAALLGTLPKLALASSKPTGRVVVIGGGYAGATVAKYLRMWSNGGLEVVVIEPSPHFISCPLSNLVLGGSKTIDELTFGYDVLQQHHGIRWVQDRVSSIDPANRKVVMGRGEVNYDKLVIAPGVDFIYDKLPSLQSEEAQKEIPHAWKAGQQTLMLQRQLQAMPDDGVFIISIPLMPFRCPPGPYERASQVASYFQKHKPRAKIMILDANPDIVSKKALFTKAWATLYPGMIDYRPNSTVIDVNVKTRTVQTEFDTVQSDVLNLIPPQRAGVPAQFAGAVNIDKRWCEVDFVTYASKVTPDVHIIGDAISAGLPKSAHMANAQGHVCAAAIVAILGAQSPDPMPVFANTCYSYVNDSMAMHVANVYRYDPIKKIMVSAEGGGVSEKPSELEGNYARYWAQNIWSDVLA